MSIVIESVKTETTDRMKKCIEVLKKDLARVRTGRATPALLDGVLVDYYGTPSPINQVANISVPEARLIVVQPWEKTLISAIEKAIHAAGLGVNPQNDGNAIRIAIPALTEAKRKDLVKECKQIAEDGKVAARNVRRDSNEKLKNAEKGKTITEDEHKKGLDETQKITDKFIKEIDDILHEKEKEVMSV